MYWSFVINKKIYFLPSNLLIYTDQKFVIEFKKRKLIIAHEEIWEEAGENEPEKEKKNFTKKKTN